MRRRADEDHLWAEVRMPGTAMVAMPARLVGVDSDQRPTGKAERRQIFRQPAAELVSRYERLHDLRRADTAVLVIVQVTAADAHCRHVEQRLSLSPLSQVERRIARVAGGMEEDGMAHRERPTAVQDRFTNAS